MGNGAIESSLPIEEKSLGLAGDGKGTAPPSSQDASFAQTALTEARPSDDVNNPTQLVMLRPTIEHNQARLRSDSSRPFSHTMSLAARLESRYCVLKTLSEMARYN